MGYRIIDNFDTIKIVKNDTDVLFFNKTNATVVCNSSIITLKNTTQSTSFKFTEVDSPRYASVESLVDAINGYINANYSYNGQYVESVWVKSVDLLSTGQSV